MALSAQPVGGRATRLSPPAARRIAARRQAIDTARPLDPLVACALALLVLRPTLDMFRATNLGPLTVTDLVGLAIIGVTIPPLLLRSVRYPSGRVFAMLLAYSILATTYGLAALIWRPVHDYPASAVRLGCVICAVVVMYDIGTRRLSLALGAVGLSAVVPCLTAIEQVVNGTGLQPSKYAPTESQLVRSFGTFDHPNALAIFSAFVIVTAAALLVENPKDAHVRRGLWWLLVGLCSIAVLATYTRSVWAAVPLTIVIVAAVSGRLRLTFVSLGLMIGLAVFLGAADISVRLSGDSSLRFRETLWRGLIHQMNAAHVALGLGLGQVDSIVASTTQRLGIYQVEQVHNDYLRVFLETGLVGLVLYFGAIAWAAARAWRTLRRAAQVSWEARTAARTVLGACLITAIISITDNIFQEAVLQMVFWGLIAAGLGALDRSERQPPPDPAAGAAQ